MKLEFFFLTRYYLFHVFVEIVRPRIFFLKKNLNEKLEKKM